MRKIELEFDEDTFKTLKMEAQTRALAGNMWGLLDAFICRLVDKVDKGEEEWKVIQKNKENHWFPPSRGGRNSLTPCESTTYNNQAKINQSFILRTRGGMIEYKQLRILRLVSCLALRATLIHDPKNAVFG